MRRIVLLLTLVLSMLGSALLPVVPGQFPFVGMGGRAWLQEQGGVIQPDVVMALQTAAEVEVIIHLTSVSLAPPDEVDPATLDEYKRQVAAVQDRVLAKLTPADFTLTVRYSVSAALAGRITESGVEKLRGHPDVNIVSIDDGVFLEPIELLPTPSGDTNCDGDVTSIDAALILQARAGVVRLLPCGGNGDVNHDGRMDAIDAVLILQYAAGLIDSLPL